MKNLSMNFDLEPEVVVLSRPGPNGCYTSLSYWQSNNLLAWQGIAFNNVTLINPLNVQDFFEGIAAGNLTEVKTRWGFSDDANLMCFANYIEA